MSFKLSVGLVAKMIAGWLLQAKGHAGLQGVALVWRMAFSVKLGKWHDLMFVLDAGVETVEFSGVCSI